MNHQTVLTVDW